MDFLEFCIDIKKKDIIKLLRFSFTYFFLVLFININKKIVSLIKVIVFDT